jgi:hypothetical protein
MRFLRFQVIFGHAVTHCQYSKICPKLPKSAVVCEFQHTPLCKMTFFQGSISLVDIRFC